MVLMNYMYMFEDKTISRKQTKIEGIFLSLIFYLKGNKELIILSIFSKEVRDHAPLFLTCETNYCTSFYCASLFVKRILKNIDYLGE